MKFHRNRLRLLPICVIATTALASLVGCTAKQKHEGPELRILTYSSLGSKGGFLDSVTADFEAKSKCSLHVVTTLGATQVLSYLDEERQRKELDLVMGIDPLLFERAKSAFYIADQPAPHPEQKVIPVLQGHYPVGFIPVDYGALSFIYRKPDFKGKTLPTHLADLLKPEFKNKWVVQDPRASSPGLLFFLFADSLMIRISDLSHSWSTLAPSWDSSYKMFLAHDTSMVWSYLTSLAYHASKGELNDYGAIDFKEGTPLQIEGMAVLNRVGNPYAANPCLEKWIAFVLSPEIQAKMVSKQFMMPVIPGVKLPQYFESVPEVKKVATLEFTLDKVDRLISRFGREVQGDSL
jgi:thiamine transport system substrate-binding protein